MKANPIVEQLKKRVKELENEIARLKGQTMFYCKCGSGGISEEAAYEIDRLKSKLDVLRTAYAKRQARKRRKAGNE